MPNTVPYETIIDRVVRRSLESHGLDRVEAKLGFDHDGDAALFVYAILAPNTPLIPGDVSAQANVALHSALKETEAPPLVYLYIQHPDDERPEAASGPVESVSP